MKTNLKVTLPTLALLATQAGFSTMDGKKNKAATQATPAAPAVQPEKAKLSQEPAVLRVDSIDGKKEVAYRCGAKGNQPLTVMYGFKDGQVAVAQVRFQGKVSPGLFRLVDNTSGNTFISNGISWSTDIATPANVDKVDGNMLTQAAVETINGKQMPVDQIVAKYCKLDKVATAKLAKAAKK